MQLAAADSQMTRNSILAIALDLVRTAKNAADVFADLDIPQLDIHGKLQTILSKPPTIAIPIDGVPSDLQAWAGTLKFKVKVWVIEKYQSLNASSILYSVPDENLPTITTITSKGRSTSTVVARWSQPYQDVMQAGLTHEGQRVFWSTVRGANRKGCSKGFCERRVSSSTARGCL